MHQAEFRDEIWYYKYQSILLLLHLVVLWALISKWIFLFHQIELYLTPAAEWMKPLVTK